MGSAEWKWRQGVSEVLYHTSLTPEVEREPWRSGTTPKVPKLFEAAGAQRAIPGGTMIGAQKAMDLTCITEKSDRSRLTTLSIAGAALLGPSQQCSPPQRFDVALWRPVF